MSDQCCHTKLVWDRDFHSATCDGCKGRIVVQSDDVVPTAPAGYHYELVANGNGVETINALKADLSRALANHSADLSLLSTTAHGGTNDAAQSARAAIIEECATVALEQRCVHGTDWDLACTTIAGSIRALASGSEREGKG